MIEILGIKRVLVLAVLIAINAMLAFWVYTNLSPKYENQDRQLRTVQGQINTTRQSLDQILTEFGQIERQKEHFETLKKRGFFDEQNRIEAQNLLQEILYKSQVVSARATIGGGKVSDPPALSEAGHQVLTSPISIEITALEDVDIYRYLWLLEKGFSGYIHVKTFNLNRQADITREILQSIISGQNPEIVSAKIEADWVTLIPTSGRNQQQGGVGW